tara:strand:+ start:529 stop:1236 length:708 start_codon:yes stop_codon:yes gene_type:complete
MSGTSSIQQLPNEMTQNIAMKVEEKVNPMNKQQMPQQQMMQQQMPQQQMPQQQMAQQQMMQQQIPQQMMPQMSQQMAPQMQNTIVSQQPQMNTVAQGLQHLQQSTDLPSRDIPMNTEHITHDNTVRPNYVPESNAPDYIQDEESFQEMIDMNKKQNREMFEINELYDELTTPILVMSLYFIFQLPFLQKLMLKHVPSLFTNDNNLSLSGYILKTILFGGSFYGLTKLIRYVSELE